MAPREIVMEFYASDTFLDVQKVQSLLHPEVTLHWNSSTGFLLLDFNQISAMSDQMKQSYVRLKNRISHLVVENDIVMLRYANFVKTIENPREEMHLADFMVVWEVKDGKLFRGFQMSYLP